MNLHRSGKRPEWETVTHNERNSWQRLAARTHGAVTPPNVVTLIGFIIVLIGLGELLARQYSLALVLLIIGRLADVVDGWLAERTGTKSPLGESLDAGFDKIGIFFTLGVLFVTKTAPWWVIVGFLVPHLIISLISINAQRRSRRLHPSRIGKTSMALAAAGIAGFIAAAIPSWSSLQGTVLVLTYICTLGSILLGIIAMGDYARQAR